MAKIKAFFTTPLDKGIESSDASVTASEKPIDRAPGTAGRQLTYPALLLKQNEHRFFFTTIPIDDLFSYCYVARRDEDTERGFQRALSQERAESIAMYLAAGTGSIPSNIVLSAQELAEFSFDSRLKTVSFERKKKQLSGFGWPTPTLGLL